MIIYLLLIHPPPVIQQRSQFKGDPHALTTTELVIHMHFYIVLESNPYAYVEDEWNLYWKTTMNERDLDIIPFDRRKWIYMEISLVHLLHHICTYIYIFNKIFIKHKLATLQGLTGVKNIVS
jgi:hypothetical protein